MDSSFQPREKVLTTKELAFRDGKGIILATLRSI